MKKFLIVITLLVMVLILASCNKDCVDTVYTYDYAIVKLPNGEVEQVEIQQWTDYSDGEQIQIKAKDGAVILVHASNVILVKE